LADSIDPNPINPDIVQARLAAIVATSDDAIVSKNLEGIVQSWNAAAERIFGWTAAEMIGQPILKIIPPDRVEEEPKILQRLQHGERVDHFETIRMRKDGRLIDVSVTISPIRDANGKVVGASKIARDITQLKRVLEEREQLLKSEQSARFEAERINRVKDEFLATLSHELRTPLNAILGWAQLLRSGALPQSDWAEGVETIERNARAQTQLIEELLDISRIISGKLRLDVQRIDLAAVVEATIDTMKPAADAKGLRLFKIIDPNAGPITGDPNRLQQVVWNLLSNAIKFTPKGGRVQVFLQRVNSHAEITVTDTGQGIEKDFLPHLFLRFSQADSSTTRHHSGLGLGLAIVRHLVELHGGTVHASSGGRGQGSSFTIQLPLSVFFEPEQPRKVEHPRTELPPQHVNVDLNGVKVLVVDDERDARTLIRRVLEMHGATVVTAETAGEAMDLLQKNRPDVLLSDIGMPDEDGYSLLQKLRQLEANQGGETPAVALTAFARSEDRRKALLAGFQMHVAKPVEAGELVAVVANLSGVTRRKAPAS
jgi:PAS domain S-box-containing protein